jgi:AraC family transcriptional regulator
MFAQTGLRVSSYRPNATMASHQHDKASLSIVIDGGYKEVIGKEERAYGRGFIVYCPPGMPHAQTFGSSGARQVVFNLPDDWVAYLVDGNLRLGEAPFANSTIFHQLGRKLQKEMRNSDDFTAPACEGILLEVVATFGRNHAACAANPPSWLRSAHEFIQQYAFAPPLTLARIANAAGRHEIHLAREFHRYYGVSIGTHIRTLKTDRAAQLLSDRRFSISEIALQCSFASHAHLCREFKARFGVTPSQYRARDI